MTTLQFFIAFILGGITGCTLLVLSLHKYGKNLTLNKESTDNVEQSKDCTSYTVERIGEYLHLCEIDTKTFCCKAKTPEELAQVFYKETKIPFALAAGKVDDTYQIWFLSRGRLEY